MALLPVLQKRRERGRARGLEFVRSAHLHEQIAAAIRRATFGCLPARLQDAAALRSTGLAKGSSSGPTRNGPFSAASRTCLPVNIL